MTHHKKILLTGATGFIGSHLRNELQDQGYDIAPISRSTGFDFNRMTAPEDWRPHLENVDAVINAVGIIVETRTQQFETLHYRAPIALFHACFQLGINRIIQISALGADNNAFTPYQRSKKAADDILRELPVDWFVLRPSLVYGKGGVSMQLFQRLSRLPLIPLIAHEDCFVQPVHVSDLVAMVKQCLITQHTRQTFDVAGPQPLTFKAWLQSFRKHEQRLPARTVSIPFELILAFSRLGHFIVPLMHPDNLRMLKQGNVADVKPLVEFLGRFPMSVKEGLCLI